MRRDFYCLTPEPDRTDGAEPVSRGDLGASALRLLRQHPATRPLTAGIAVTGSIAALAVASPINAALNPAAEATQPVVPPAQPAPPTAEKPDPDLAVMGRVDHALTEATKAINTAEKTLTAVSAGGEPAALQQLRSQAENLTHAVTGITSSTDTVRRLQKPGEPAAQAALSRAESLLRQAEQLRENYATRIARAQQTATDQAADQALRQAAEPIRSAEAAARRATDVGASLDRAFDSGQPATAAAATMLELAAAIEAATGPTAGGLAAAKAAIQATKSASEHHRGRARQLLDQADDARATIHQLTSRLPALHRQLLALQQTEATAKTVDKALAAHNAAVTADQAARKTSDSGTGPRSRPHEHLAAAIAAIHEARQALSTTPPSTNNALRAAEALLTNAEATAKRTTDALTPPANRVPSPVHQHRPDGPATRPADARPADTRPVSGRARTPSTNAGPGAAAVRAALTQLGVPYRWGGVSPGKGFDCSGLTQWAYRQAGVRIPRTSTAQAVGARVTREQLQPGDLVVWQGHVAMYIGEGRMVEAGDPVRISRLRTTNLSMRFIGFYRPAG
ncbi:C40 family peptidase [Crossiella sp. SN42]|uniref:C40 family peptidase n=1 Tax=Crossiella sp. SN42 TaxID=2944808 RepID=UPI0035ABE026